MKSLFLLLLISGLSYIRAHSIVVNVARKEPFNVGCVNGITTVSQLSFLFTTSVNGMTAVSPMTETGLPVMLVAFSVNGNPSPSIMVSNPINTATSAAIAPNVWKFTLLNDHATEGAERITLGACDPNAGVPTVTAQISCTNDIICGAGLPALGIPAVCAVATANVKLNAANIPTQAPTVPPTTTVVVTTPAPDANIMASTPRPTFAPVTAASDPMMISILVGVGVIALIAVTSMVSAKYMFSSAITPPETSYNAVRV